MEAILKRHGVEFNATNLVLAISNIAQVSNDITAVFHATRNINPSKITPLHTDGLGFIFPDENGNINVSPDSVAGWIFCKGTEDIVASTIQSLIEVYALLSLHEIAGKSKQNPFKSSEEIDEFILKTYSKAKKLHLPGLIEKIEAMLGVLVPFKSDILNINNIRRCLVHRNGVATEDDFEKGENNRFCVSFLCLDIEVKMAGNYVPLTKKIKDERHFIEGMKMTSKACFIEFIENEKIRLSADNFKDITYTAIKFIQGIIPILPISEEIKNGILRPFEANLEFN